MGTSISTLVLATDFQGEGRTYDSVIDIGGDERWPDPHFVRGDADDDGDVDAADQTYLLNAIFGGGPPPPCEDAADANDDGIIDISDPLTIVFYLVEGRQIPLPGPFVCGWDRTPDSLSCSTTGCEL